MFPRLHSIPAIALLAACLALPGGTATAADKPSKLAAATVAIAYLQLADDPRYEEDRLYARNLAQPEGRPDAALDALVKESRCVTPALGVIPRRDER